MCVLGTTQHVSIIISLCIYLFMKLQCSIYAMGRNVNTEKSLFNNAVSGSVHTALNDRMITEY